MLKKNDQRKLMKEELEDTDVMAVESSAVDKVEKRNGVICPLIFSDNRKFIAEHSIIDVPLNRFMQGNIAAIRDCTRNLSPRTLASRGYDNIEVAKILITDFIIQNVFPNACSLLVNEPDFLRYKEYFYLEQFIQKELDDSKNYIRLLLDNCCYSNRASGTKNDYYSAYNSVVVDDNDETAKNVEVTMNNIAIICNQIKSIIYNAVCVGIDKGINDVIFEVHINPNNDEFIRRLTDDKSYYNFINEYEEKGYKIDYNTAVALYLKNIIYNGYNMRPFIYAINNIVETSVMNYLPVTGFYLFYDLANMRSDNANKNIDQKPKQ